MIIDSTPLDLEIKRVINSNFSPTFYNYTGQFKIGAKVYDVLKIVEIDEEADYELAYGAIKQLTVALSLGDYSTIIYPAKGSLEFILKTEDLNPNNYASTDGEGSVEVVTYNVSLDPNARPFMSEDNNMETMDRETQNLMDIVQISIQLKPKLLDDVSKVTVGGNIINTTNAKVIRDAITFYCAQLELDDDNKLLGVDMHASASTTVKNEVIIPHGINLFDLADYVQMKTGGVFPSGMAQFVHDRVWYVYPPYDTSGFDDAKEKIVVVSVPAKRFPQIEKSYLTQNGITTILATGNKKIKSDKSQIQDNAGNGVMFADANQILSGFSQDKNGISVAKRSNNNSEFVGEANPSGKNNVKMSPEGISANPYIATSRLARSQGHFYMVEWENCDPKIIKPGLNAKILFLNEGEVKEVNGVLLKSHVQTKINGTGMMATGYRSFAVMMLFVRSEDAATGGLVGLE